MNKIALLTYPYLLSWFEEAVSGFRSQCDIDLVPFTQQHQLLDMIPSLSTVYDGLCVFSASVEGFLQQSRAIIPKPVVYLDRFSVDFFKTFFVLLNNNRDIDFSRILLDTSLIRQDTLRSLEHVVKNIASFEENRLNYMQELDMDDFFNLESRIEQNALDYWRRGKYDLLVCRIASVAEALDRENIPHIFIYPEKNRIGEAIDRLMNRIRLDKQREGLPASIMIVTAGNSRREYHEISYESIRIQKALLEFSKNHASNFTVQFISQGYEILTSHVTAQRITDDFSCCQLGYYLFSTLGISFHIGYGIGLDIAGARQNALIAVRAAIDSGLSCLVSEDGRAVPLQARPAALSAHGQGSGTSFLTNRTGLSPITLQRIRSALQFLGTQEVTNHELAEALQVTVANANRFLNSLLKSGHAEISDIKKSSTKGRPSRIYRIHL